MKYTIKLDSLNAKARTIANQMMEHVKGQLERDIKVYAQKRAEEIVSRLTAVVVEEFPQCLTELVIELPDDPPAT